MSKLTIRDLLNRKGKRQFSYVRVDSVAQASAAQMAGIDMIGTAFEESTRGFPGSAPDTHFRFGLKYGQYANGTEILRAAFSAMENGADSVYTAQSMEMVSILAREGIPVFGHIGLVPPKMGWTGGYCAVGKTSKEAVKLFHEVKDYESAGAVGIEIEVVPYLVATEISRRTPLLTMSLGSGSGCDMQYLFASDILGETVGRIPRHARIYRNFNEEYARLERERINAFREFVDDIDSGAFPLPKHLVEISASEFDSFINEIDE
ncbi:MAG: 3-methyl-2-oxobutanoate hydroxymethyltransferase [marine bacterium B5-7]|nr:MAG: 3-methyl-2-oxobutanoate hydroxymethyltransferase [marine bacterium B5-7]